MQYWPSVYFDCFLYQWTEKRALRYEVNRYQKYVDVVIFMMSEPAYEYKSLTEQQWQTDSKIEGT